MILDWGGLGWNALCQLSRIGVGGVSWWKACDEGACRVIWVGMMMVLGLDELC